MSIFYNQLLRVAAQRVNAIAGGSHSAKNTAYLTGPIALTQLGKMDFPFAHVCDIAVGVVGEIISTYAKVHHHPYRAFNTEQSGTIASGSPMPSVGGTTSYPMVGVYGAIKSVTAPYPVLTKMPIRVVESVLANQDGFLKGTYYYYDIVGEKIYHTVAAGVTVDMVTFSAAAEFAKASGANNHTSAVPIPDALLLLAADGIASKLIIDDDYMNQAQYFAQHYARGLTELAQGGTVYSPAPIAQANADPVAS